MKLCRMIFLAGVLCICICMHNHVIAQPNNGRITASFIDAYPLTVSDTKTTNLIFPYAIISVDKGSTDILVQKAKGVENILQLKAVQPDITKTNLTVVTNDGQFYSFSITYASDPQIINLQVFKDSGRANKSLMLAGPGLNQEAVNATISQVEGTKRFIHINSSNQRIKFDLKGVYLKDNIFWFSFSVKNSSFVDYKVESIRLFVKDSKRVKRTALQENEVVPLFNNPGSIVLGKSMKTFVLGFKPFTIPKSQRLIIQASEENGGRMLTLNCSHKVLTLARPLKF